MTYLMSRSLMQVSGNFAQSVSQVNLDARVTRAWAVAPQCHPG